MECGNTIEDRLKVKIGGVWPHYRGQPRGKNWWRVGHPIEDNLKVNTGGVCPHYRGQPKGYDWWRVTTL